jgi:hypothetical protein
VARSVAAQTEGLIFTGADIWVPRGQLVGTGNSVFLLGTAAPYYAKRLAPQAMAVAARAGSASPLCELGVQARRKGKDPPRLGSPRALCKNWRQRARLSCSRAAGSRPSRDGISQLRGLLALWDSTKATQTPQCGGYRAGVVCHRRAPRFDRRRAAAERCSRSNLAAATSQPRVCRRSSL